MRKHKKGGEIGVKAISVKARHNASADNVVIACN